MKEYQTGFHKCMRACTVYESPQWGLQDELTISRKTGLMYVYGSQMSFNKLNWKDYLIQGTHIKLMFWVSCSVNGTLKESRDVDGTIKRCRDACAQGSCTLHPVHTGNWASLAGHTNCLGETAILTDLQKEGGKTNLSNQWQKVVIVPIYTLLLGNKDNISCSNFYFRSGIVGIQWALEQGGCVQFFHPHLPIDFCLLHRIQCHSARDTVRLIQSAYTYTAEGRREYYALHWTCAHADELFTLLP